MKSPSAGAVRDAGARSLVAGVAPPVAVAAPSSTAGAPVDTTQLDRLVGKALTAAKNGRYALSSASSRRAADEALRLYGESVVSAQLTVQRSNQLILQAQPEGVTRDEMTALKDEAWALVSSTLTLLVRRINANTLLPGRVTAVETAFFKRFMAIKHATLDEPQLPTRLLQVVGLSVGYATVVLAAELLLRRLHLHHGNEAQAFVLRVVDCMLPAARSLPEIVFPEEIVFASTIEQVLSGAFPAEFDAAFVASLRIRWTAAVMVQMRRERSMLDASKQNEKMIEKDETRWSADVAEHGLKRCALPSCDKIEASVLQHKFCSACRSVSYCSEEHCALHWKKHKPVCRATTAARHAADDAGAGAA